MRFTKSKEPTKLSKRDLKSVGKFNKQECPECQAKLMENSYGLIWCSGIYCYYGFDKIKQFYWGNKKYQL
jgi:hypothetical protein